MQNCFVICGAVPQIRCYRRKGSITCSTKAVRGIQEAIALNVILHTLKVSS
jgi:hypothetical protein